MQSRLVRGDAGADDGVWRAWGGKDCAAMACTEFHKNYSALTSDQATILVTGGAGDFHLDLVAKASQNLFGSEAKCDFRATYYTLTG
jgi:hypothetical protein